MIEKSSSESAVALAHDLFPYVTAHGTKYYTVDKSLLAPQRACRSRGNSYQDRRFTEGIICRPRKNHRTPTSPSRSVEKTFVDLSEP